MRRRKFLMGAGGICVGLPMLRTFYDGRDARAAGGDNEPTRIITMAYPMGTHLPFWTPDAVGSEFNLGTITEPLAPFVDRCALISNCPHSVYDLGGGSYVYGHPAKKEGTLTGTLLQSAFTGDGSNTVENVLPDSNPGDEVQTPNGPSVDHVIGEGLITSQHQRASVDLGVAGAGGPAGVQNSSFFYEAAANPVTLSAHPGQAFVSLFSAVTPDDGEVDEVFMALQRRRKSVLDAVRESFVDLRQGLDASDRAVLDDHADKIRQIELDMPPLAACSLPEGIPEADEAYANMPMTEFGDLTNRLMAHAMGCGIAPVGRIEYTGQQNPYFGIPTVDDGVTALGGDWHQAVHADGVAPDADLRTYGFQFFVQQFADLMGYLDAIVEGPDGRTALDNSLMLLASDYGEGNGHASRDLCFVVAGGSGPGRRNFHFDGQNNTVNDVLTTLIQMACVTHKDGSPIEEFGLAGFGAAPISELLV